MTRPTAYQMQLETIKSLNRIEDKLDKRIESNSRRIDEIEHKQDNLLGKVGIGILLVSGVMSIALTSVVQWIRGLIK